METPDYFINFDPKAHKDENNLHFYEPAGINEEFGPGPGVARQVKPTPSGNPGAADDSDNDEDLSYKSNKEKDDDDISYDGNPTEPAKAKQSAKVVKPKDTLDDDISYDGNNDRSADDLSYDGNTNNNAKNNLAKPKAAAATVEDDLSYGDDGANSDISA